MSVLEAELESFEAFIRDGKVFIIVTGWRNILEMLSIWMCDGSPAKIS